MARVGAVFSSRFSVLGSQFSELSSGFHRKSPPRRSLDGAPGSRQSRKNSVRLDRVDHASLPSTVAQGRLLRKSRRVRVGQPVFGSFLKQKAPLIPAGLLAY